MPHEEFYYQSKVSGILYPNYTELAKCEPRHQNGNYDIGYPENSYRCIRLNPEYERVIV